MVNVSWEDRKLLNHKWKLNKMPNKNVKLILDLLILLIRNLTGKV